MKTEYKKPEITFELLEKADVLTISEEKDNNYVNSTQLTGFNLKSIL